MAFYTRGKNHKLFMHHKKISVLNEDQLVSYKKAILRASRQELILFSSIPAQQQLVFFSFFLSLPVPARGAAASSPPPRLRCCRREEKRRTFLCLSLSLLFTVGLSLLSRLLPLGSRVQLLHRPRGLHGGSRGGVEVCALGQQRRRGPVVAVLLWEKNRR